MANPSVPIRLPAIDTGLHPYLFTNAPAMGPIQYVIPPITLAIMDVCVLFPNSLDIFTKNKPNV